MDRMQLQNPAPAGQIAGRVRRSFELGESLSALAQTRLLLPAWCFVGFSAACVVAMVAVGMSSARGCRVAPVPLTPGASTELAIVMPVDTPCAILIRAGSATLDDISIALPPQHGTLTTRGRSGAVYRPNRGFAGDDAFTFSVNPSGANRESSTIRVQASIR